jgi:hypothetical protein
MAVAARASLGRGTAQTRLAQRPARGASRRGHRVSIARNLLTECECRNNHPGSRGSGENTLLPVGYDRWVLYKAASARDMAFVQELLDRDPLLEFGEGEFDVTDMFYAVARGESSNVFRLYCSTTPCRLGARRIAGMGKVGAGLVVGAAPCSGMR